jgi:hypothetical protein
MYTELHHIVPQAWQRFWWPGQQNPEIGQDLHVPALWDKEVMALCRTGHGNVHTILAALMKGNNPPAKRGKEVDVAKMAMDRFVLAGGSLDALRAAKLWGQI